MGPGTKMGHDRFRAEVRSWFASQAPPGWQTRADEMSHIEMRDFQRDWLRQLNTEGFGAPHVPQEWGGGGYGVMEQAIIYQEWARSQAPPLPLFSVSLHHVPSTLLLAGTRRQQERFIRDAIDGVVWCQGFSEPEAGSDLASLRTRAVLVNGGEYRVTGRKIWSSHAALAEHCLLLVRTSTEGTKHEGISYLILDMNEPGVTVQPIRQSTGHEDFCELVLENVRVPVEHRIGEEGEGWAVAQETLSAERGPIAVETVERMNAGLESLHASTLRHGASGAHPGSGPLAEELVDLTARGLAVRSLALDAVEDVVDGRSARHLASLIKVSSSEYLRDLTEFGTRLDVSSALESPEHRFRRSWISGHWMTDFINSWGWSIASGTNEIQRNIIARRILDMPRE